MRLHRLNGDSSEGSCFLLLPRFGHCGPLAKPSVLGKSRRAVFAWRLLLDKLAGAAGVSVACPITGVKAAAMSMALVAGVIVGFFMGVVVPIGGKGLKGGSAAGKGKAARGRWESTCGRQSRLWWLAPA